MGLDSKLQIVDKCDLNGKVVLVRVDHNVVGKGKIKDAFRIDSTFGIIHYISAHGGFPILMTHVGRTRDKKTGQITTGSDSAVEPVVEYLNRKMNADFKIPQLPIHPQWGIESLDAKILAPYLADLKARKIGGIYLPNTRWFQGEEAKDGKADVLAREMAAIADLYINEAFGSWQAHASTFAVAQAMPACAGFLMQKEILGLDRVLNPQAPFVGVVAGSKYDTKIGPLNKLYERVDNLLLGGVIYNAFLCAKYGIEVAGVEAEDVELAKGLVEKDAKAGKILEPGSLIESKIMDKRDPAQCRIVHTKDFKAGEKYAYFLDVAPESFDDAKITKALASAKTIFINAVMGFTPNFGEGSARMYKQIGENKEAQKLYGGGDTLTELKNLCPGLYLKALDDPGYYFFTGGGAVLTAIEEGSAYGLKPVAALLQ